MSGVEAMLTLPEVEAHVRALHGGARALTPDEEDVLQVYAEELRDYVVDRWPVDTGTSADAWEVETRVSPGEYGVLIANDMYYAEWVHYAGTAPEPPLWRTLIPEAWSLVKPRLVSALNRAVDETEALLAAYRAQSNATVLNVYRRPRGTLGRAA